MTIIEKIGIFFQKKFDFSNLLEVKSFRVTKFNPIILVTFLIFFSCIFFISLSLINKKNQNNASNFKEITETKEFSNLTNFLVSKINSPYQEIKYIIKKNDTVEKILKKFEIEDDDIRKISIQLNEKQLTNIYSGKKLSLILKKLEGGSNTVVHLVYPINNTTKIEIRKTQNNFFIKGKYFTTL